MIDTIKIAHDLTAGSSLSQNDSEAIVQTIAKMQANELATKTDIADLKTEFADVKTNFAELKGEVNLLRWMTATNLILLIAILVKLFVHA